MKARPFTERLPTLDAWNAAIQRSLTPTISIEVSYVGNKGTHTLSDGDGNNTNPNESAIALPATYSLTGNALHYDPNGGNCVLGSSLYPCNFVGATSIGANGAVKNTTLLQRYVGGNLAACGTGPCNWTQGISYYGDDQDTHYNAIQAKVTKTLTQGFNINLNYAYQQGRSTASNFATWNKQAVISNDSNIRRSAFTAYGLWRLPFGKGQLLANNTNWFVNGIISGWELSPTIVWQSGLPFSLSYSNCGASIPGDAPCEPNGSVSNITYNVQGTPGVGSGVTMFSPVISPSDVKAGNNLCNAASVSGGFTWPRSRPDRQHKAQHCFRSQLLQRGRFDCQKRRHPRAAHPAVPHGCLQRL